MALKMSQERDRSSAEVEAGSEEMRQAPQRMPAKVIAVAT